MDAVIVVSEERAPLIHSSPPLAGGPPEEEADEIRPWKSDQPPPSVPPGDDQPPKPAPPDPKQRLASLDVFRGLTVALMILVDDAGGKFPSINHSPWFGVTLADFVMPFFLFGVGVSVALVFKKVPSKLTASKKIMMRAIKLFLLGVLLQGGYFHGRGHLTYGIDIDHIRWLGVLQRIAIGYFLAAMSEIWLVNNILVDSLMSFVKKYCLEWMVAIMLSSIYLGLLYGLYVPNWAFEVSSSNSSVVLGNSQLITEAVQCGVRGSLEPPCNAVGLVDRLFLGEKHLYQNPVYKRTKECSVNSPDYGPLPLNSPGWCLAPFDPEGLLSSVMAAVTCFAGLHFGHVVVHFKSHTPRVLLWFISSLIFLLCGLAVQMLGIDNNSIMHGLYLKYCKRVTFSFISWNFSFLSGMPLSKPLYTLSYMLLTTGVSGIVLTLIYCTDKIKEARNTQQVTQGNCSLQPILTEVLGDNKGKYIRGKGSHTKKKDVDTSAGRYEQEALNELIKQNQELRHTFRGEIEAREQRRDAQFKEEMQEVRGILSVLCRALNVPLPNQSSRPEDNVSASRRLGSNEDLTGTSQ